MELTVRQLAERLGGELVGEGSAALHAVGTIEGANDDEVTFFSDARYLARLRNSRAGAVITGNEVEGLDKPQLIVKNVNAALIEALGIFAPKPKAPAEGIDPTAKIGERVKICKGVSIGAGASIDDGVEIGENTVIAGGCKIGENSRLGNNCRLDCNVVIYHNCLLGNNVIIQANTTIGSTGFGYYFIDGTHRLIPHNGRVVIEDFVEIGANCCVDRAKFEETRIGAGTKIDNLVQIAHNVIIGKCCLIAGEAGIAGNARIGDGVVLAGGAGVVDNVKIGDGTMIAVSSVALQDVPAGKKLLGVPATDIKEQLRVIGLTRRLPKLVEQLKQVSKRLDKLETAKDDNK
jgi:UDP-3-O-[3-hydroxymyristoyl] glucosamine N-acyltransferase